MKKIIVMSIGMFVAVSAFAATAQQDASMVKASLVAPVAVKAELAIVDGFKAWTENSPGRPTSY